MTNKKSTRSQVDISQFDKEQLIKIGQHVKKLREATGDSYAVFAEKYGINRISQYRIEKGENFLMNNLLKILKGLDITLGDFFATMPKTKSNA
ncbi:MAG: helix-turn-helix transcriptional regulator [Reichenbachiella sp.]|uniref:helix-turn-helix domain-containing protein n=1 Tax=Reichenbachiella sp. TaxID=2184521 RepID=UPI003266A524